MQEISATPPDGSRAPRALLVGLLAWVAAGAGIAALAAAHLREFQRLGVMLPWATECALELGLALGRPAGWVGWSLLPLLGWACWRAGGEPRWLGRGGWLCVALALGLTLSCGGALDLPWVDVRTSLAPDRQAAEDELWLRRTADVGLTLLGGLAALLGGLGLVAAWLGVAAGIARAAPGEAREELARALVLAGPPGLAAGWFVALLAPDLAGFVLLQAPPRLAVALTACGLVCGAVLLWRLRPRRADSPARTGG